MPRAIPRARPPIPKSLQLRVFRCDGWLCQSCNRPVIFAPAMRLLAGLVHNAATREASPAYYHTHWTRTHAPLLDELGACIDHIKAHSRGGSSLIDNLATMCSKCNTRKGAREAAEHRLQNPPKPIKAKYGEPTAWDGLTQVFVALATGGQVAVTPADRVWLRALQVKEPPSRTEVVEPYPDESSCPPSGRDRGRQSVIKAR